MSYIYQLGYTILEHSKKFNRQELVEIVQDARDIINSGEVEFNPNYMYIDANNETEMIVWVLHCEYGFDIVDSTVIEI